MMEPTTRDRVMGLVESGKALNLTCVGRVVGVSRERVRQIVRGEGSSFGRNSGSTLLEWPCPDCGETVRMWSKNRNQRKTVWCKQCARKHRAHQSHCKRGHPLTAENICDEKTRRCMTCRDEYHRQYRANPVNKARAHRWRQENPERVVGYQRAYYRAYYQRNRERLKAEARARYHARRELELLGRESDA